MELNCLVGNISVNCRPPDYKTADAMRCNILLRRYLYMDKKRCNVLCVEVIVSIFFTLDYIDFWKIGKPFMGNGTSTSPHQFGHNCVAVSKELYAEAGIPGWLESEVSRPDWLMRWLDILSC